MAKKTERRNVLTEEFIMDMFYTAMQNERILSVLVNYLEPQMLPSRDYIAVHEHLKTYYDKYQKVPSYSVIKQMIANNRGALACFDEIFASSELLETEEVLSQLEDYIKQVRFQKAYREIGEAYNRSGYDEAMKKMNEYVEWASSFSLLQSEFVDVVATFDERYMENKQKYKSKTRRGAIYKFYIDELDAMNAGRDMRSQLTCFLAPTGVGKSHVARWVGKNAAQVDGFNVLHFQLEGSQAEAVNAYSASLVECSSYLYETGRISDEDYAAMKESLADCKGKLFVKSYPKFNAHVSTIDIRDSIRDFKKHYGLKPDVVIIDSMDLLTDSSGRRYGENGERHKRIAVANDLKDLAADEDVWMVTTYQSTIENQEWLNNEANVLTEYNTAEAKGLARPMTHLITLNQSSNERANQTMRLHVAKSRFFARSKDTIKIATKYDEEQFYDRRRTADLRIIDNNVINATNRLAGKGELSG